MWAYDHVDLIAGIDLGFAVVFMLVGFWLFSAGARLRRDAKKSMGDAAVVWSSVMRDEVESMGVLILTIEDLIRSQPEREEALSVSRLEVIARRDETARKADLLEQFTKGDLPMAEISTELEKD